LGFSAVRRRRLFGRGRAVRDQESPPDHVRRAEAGRLMSYGKSFREFYRRAASYVDKIIKGAKAGDLPIEQPSRFYFTVNLKAAKAIGLELPTSPIMRADEVIE
jgi:putative ABC transport system substrate-binding protein